MPKAALLAIALLLGVEFGVARADWIWGWVPHSESGVVDALENQVIAEVEVAPKVVLYGSSRVRDAVGPRQLEQEMGLAEGEVLNLGLTHGTPFDALTLYERNREVLSQADVAVFGVEPWQFDKVDGEVNERVNRFAGLRHRYAHEGSEQLGLLVGWVWRTYDAKPALRRFLKSLKKGRPDALPLAEDGRIEWRDRATNRRAAKRSMGHYAKTHYEDYDLSDRRSAILTEFVELLEADGIEVVVLQIPVRAGYTKSAEKHYPEQLEAFLHQCEAFSGRPLVRFEPASDYGLTAGDFYDYGHLRERGAERFTGALAPLLEPYVD